MFSVKNVIIQISLGNRVKTIKLTSTVLVFTFTFCSLIGAHLRVPYTTVHCNSPRRGRIGHVPIVLTMGPICLLRNWQDGILELIHSFSHLANKHVLKVYNVFGGCVQWQVRWRHTRTAPSNGKDTRKVITNQWYRNVSLNSSISSWKLQL